MISGFQRIIEERILEAQKKGDFDNLPDAGKPLELEDDSRVPEDLRLAYKILKNAGFVPPELQLNKDIRQTEDLLEGATSVKDKYRIMKKLKALKFQLLKKGGPGSGLNIPGDYETDVIDRMETRKKQTTDK
jgi:hypothetical protein